MLLAHGEKGEKIDRFSRESEHDRFPWLPFCNQKNLRNIPVEYFSRDI